MIVSETNDGEVHFDAPTVIKSVVFLSCMFFLIKPDPPFLPLGRAPAFLVGCIVLVLTRSITSDEALEAIDLGTLIFLMGMTLIVEILEQQRALKLFGKGLMKLGNVSALWAICFMTGILSAFLTNDGTCILLTPFILKICKQKNINPRPYLMAVASASNIGSAATLTGNPQNVIIGDKGSLEWIYFFKILSAPAVLGLIVNAIFLHIYYSREVKTQRTQALLYGELRRSDELHTRIRVQQVVVDPSERSRLLEEKLSGATPQPDEDDRLSVMSDEKATVKIRRIPKWIEQLISFLAIIGMTFAYVFGESVPWVTLAVGLIVLGARVLFTKDKVAASRISMKALANIDWSLLAFFGGNFIVIEAFNSTNIPHQIYLWVRSLGGNNGGIGELLLMCALTIFLSQIVGNVPTILMIAPEIKDPFVWIIISWAATIAGNLTMPGSAANIFVDQLMRKHGNREGLGVLNHLKFGFPTTILIFGLGFILVYILHVYGGL